MIDKERMKELMETSVQAQYENMERQVEKDEVWIDALVRQTAAIEQIANFTASLSVMVANMNRIAATLDRIDASLEKLAASDDRVLSFVVAGQEE